MLRFPKSVLLLRRRRGRVADSPRHRIKVSGQGYSSTVWLQVAGFDWRQGRDHWLSESGRHVLGNQVSGVLVHAVVGSADQRVIAQREQREQGNTWTAIEFPK